MKTNEYFVEFDYEAYDPPLETEEICAIVDDGTVESIMQQYEQQMNRFNCYGRIVYEFNNLASNDFEVVQSALDYLYSVLEHYGIIDTRLSLWAQAGHDAYGAKDFGDGDINPFRVAKYMNRYKPSWLQVLHQIIVEQKPQTLVSQKLRKKKPR